MNKYLAMTLAASLATPLAALADNPNFDANGPTNNPGYKLAADKDFTHIAANWENDFFYNDPKKYSACKSGWIGSTTFFGSDGLQLHIKSLESVPNCGDDDTVYSSAHWDGWTSSNIYKNAYWEATLKASPRVGTLTAWWLLEQTQSNLATVTDPDGAQHPPEVDGIEIFGGSIPTAYMTYHFKAADGSAQTCQQSLSSGSNLATGFHRYGVLVDNAQVSFFFDGVWQKSCPIGPGINAPLYPLFTFYTKAGNWPGLPPEARGWTADAYVKGLKVWVSPY